MVDRKDTNRLGIIGICTGLFVPISGLVLGIVSLAKKEKNMVFGIISIVVSLISTPFWWIFWLAFIVGLGGAL